MLIRKKSMVNNKKGKVLVIGGSGFVGSRLLSEVNRANFKNLDKKQSPFFSDITYVGDIRNFGSIEPYFKGVESVVLLAAEHRDDIYPKSLYHEVNVNGTRNVLKAMDKYSIKKIIFTSSVAVYGLNKNNPNEDHPVDPFNHYGKSKWEAEQVIQDWYDRDPQKKSITIIRPTVIFGERNRGNVYNLFRQIVSGKFLMIGKGRNKKSMAYVGNITAFIKSKIDLANQGFQIFNYVDKPDFSMNELLHQIEISLNRRIPRIRIPFLVGMIIGYGFDFISIITRKKLSVSSIRVKKFCATTQFKSEKMLYEFSPPFSLQKGLERTLHYEFIEKKNDNEVVFYTE